MNDKETKFGGLSWEAAKMMGFNRARALAVIMRANAGESLQTDPVLTTDDLRCDAEQIEVDEDGVVRKSTKQ
jgi:hypothetical protein